LVGEVGVDLLDRDVKGVVGSCGGGDKGWGGGGGPGGCVVVDSDGSDLVVG
jgi:hypothetical protein